MSDVSPIEIDYTLYGIADLAIVSAEQLPELARAAVAGGVSVLQLRGKGLGGGALLAAADAVRAAVEVPLVVNDRVDVAAVAGAAGVHLGDEDLPLVEAARLVPGAVLGRTVRDPAAAATAVADGAGYLGVGSVYPSGTKSGVRLIGLEGLRAVAAASTVPVVAIGGIAAGGAAACIAAGASGVAVIGALFAGAPSALEVEMRARTLRRELEAARAAGRRR